MFGMHTNKQFVERVDLPMVCMSQIPFIPYISQFPERGILLVCPQGEGYEQTHRVTSVEILTRVWLISTNHATLKRG